MPIRVFVVDDSEVFLDAVREVLDACPDFELIGAAHTGEAALAALANVTPDLVLVDVVLPGMGGLETCRRLTDLQPDATIVLTSVGEDPRVAPVDAGFARALFVPKAQISPRALRQAWQGRALSTAGREA
jgi:DNA-binding NarL/FixJ family response regulator